MRDPAARERIAVAGKPVHYRSQREARRARARRIRANVGWSRRGNPALAARDVHTMYRAIHAPKPMHWVVRVRLERLMAQVREAEAK